jgi:gag-polypeptide of LTR copia-type
MAHEFDQLALDGHNYPTWALDVKISLASRGLTLALSPPGERPAAFLEMHKYNALYIIRHHLHPDLKAEYVMEEEPHTLWVALQGRYEQQKAIILPEANHEWTHIRLQDFKSIEDYNHAVHKVCAKLRFCEKEPSDGDKIEKTLQTMLPSDRILQHQYRARNYEHYSDLIHDLLQAEKHDELTIKNHHQRRVGAAPLPEVHHNDKNQNKPAFSKNKNSMKNAKAAKRRRNRQKKKQMFKMTGKGDSSFK